MPPGQLKQFGVELVIGFSEVIWEPPADGG